MSEFNDRISVLENALSRTAKERDEAIEAVRYQEKQLSKANAAIRYLWKFIHRVPGRDTQYFDRITADTEHADIIKEAIKRGI